MKLYAAMQAGCLVFTKRAFFARVLAPRVTGSATWKAQTFSDVVGTKTSSHRTRYGAVLAVMARKAKHEARDS